MSEHYSWTIEASLLPARLDTFVANALPTISRSRVKKLLEDGFLTVDGKTVKAGYALKAGESVELTVPEVKELNSNPKEMDIPILYEDDHIAVVNKPRGMVVHPAAGHEEDTLVNGLMYAFQGRLSGIGGVLRPGIVHRIDKDTSGLLMICKSDEAHQVLSERLKVHDIDRVYHGIVHGHFKEPEGTVNAPIGRMNNDRKKMTVRPDGREAITHYKVLQEFPGFSYVELTLETGRTHQIRVHMNYLHHPLLGDPLYGPAKEQTAVERRLSHRDFWPGQILHAKVLGFDHPITGDHLYFDSDLPAYFQTVLSELSGTVR